MELLTNTAYVTPVLGNIKMGGVLNGIPYQTETFKVTDLFKENGDWANHPIDTVLRSNLQAKKE